MTTINTIEDLLQLLDDNPQWVEALRVRLLSRELIELPEKFAKFSAAMEQFVAETKSFMAETKSFMAETKSFMAETKSFEAETKSFMAETKGFMAETKSFMAETNDFISYQKTLNAEIIRRLDRLESDVKSIRDDLAPIKGAHARNAAHREALLIAEEFGFRLVRVVGFEELVSFARGGNSEGIPANHIRSFHRADLIMDVQDRDGNDCYLAVEVSYTVDERDSVRAIRNAGFLTQFTGRPAYAAASGLRYDRRVHPSIESGELFWYELDADGLEAE